MMEETTELCFRLIKDQSVLHGDYKALNQTTLVYQLYTMHPGDRQDDFWITVGFSLVWYSPHVQEPTSNH